ERPSVSGRSSTGLSEPTIVTSSPSSIQVMPRAITTRQCQRDQGRESRRAGMRVRKLTLSSIGKENHTLQFARDASALLGRVVQVRTWNRHGRIPVSDSRPSGAQPSVSSSPLWLPTPFGIEGRTPRLPRRGIFFPSASGVIAQDEAGRIPGRDFSPANANKDGRLSEFECEAAREARETKSGSPAPTHYAASPWMPGDENSSVMDAPVNRRRTLAAGCGARWSTLIL